VVLVVLILLVWFVSSLGGGDDSPAAESAASTGTLTAPTTSAGATTSAIDTGDPGSSGGGGGGPATPAGEPLTSAVPAPPGQCPDQALAITVSADKPTYVAGEEPGFAIVITNISTTPCERDLAPGLQQAIVYTLDGQTRVWSSADCYPNDQTDVKRLEGGKQEVYTVKWSAKTSEPDCAGERLPVPPGAYHVVGRLGTLNSAPVPFNIG